MFFSGDTQLQVRAAGDVYTKDYLEGLVRLTLRKTTRIYSGHDELVTSQVHETILNTLANVRNSRMIYANSESGFYA